MASYALAIAVWFVDIRACGAMQVYLPRHGIPNPQFHAWWHVLVSFGLYLLMLTLACDRMRVLGRTYAIRFAAGAVPYVR
jgi:dihydroceramidase